MLEQVTPLKAAVTKEDQDYEQSRKSDQTEAIHQADGRHRHGQGVSAHRTAGIKDIFI